jgi:hypothetical protein
VFAADDGTVSQVSLTGNGTTASSSQDRTVNCVIFYNMIFFNEKNLVAFCWRSPEFFTLHRIKVDLDKNQGGQGPMF